MRELKNLDVQLVLYGQASEIIHGSNPFKLEPVVLRNLGLTFAIEESMSLPAVDVVEVLPEKST